MYNIKSTHFTALSAPMPLTYKSYSVHHSDIILFGITNSNGFSNERIFQIGNTGSFDEYSYVQP
jgi:hypothetical protein